MSPAVRSPVADVTGKIRRRRRRTWVRRLVIIGSVVLALALIGTGVWLVGFSDVLAARNVAVTGAKTVTADDVRARAQVPLGTPLARLDTGAIAARVAELPQVAKVDVRRDFPHTVTVAVTERVPVYAAHNAAIGWRLVDATGRDFLAVPQPPAGLVTAEVADAKPETLRDVAAIVAALPPDLRGGGVKAPTRDSIELDLADGRVVFFGSADQAQLKVDVARKLMAAVQAKVYDVSAPSHPVTR